MKCTKCGFDNTVDAKYCQRCGTKMSEMEVPVRKKGKLKRKIAIWFIVFLLGAVAVISILFYKGILNIDLKEMKINKEYQTIFNLGMNYLEEDKYEEAINEFEKIDTSWEEYKKVEDKIKEAKGLAAYEQMRQFYSDKDYKSAIQVYKGNTKYFEDNTDVEEFYHKCVVLFLMREIEQYKKDDDYASIIQIINDHIEDVKDDVDIMAELSTSEQFYREMIISEAKELYESEGYSQAAQKINEGLAVLPFDESLMNEKEKYQGVEPMELASLEPYAYEEARKLADSENETDIQGNIYENSLCGETKAISSNTYDIGGNYDVLKSTIAVSERSKGSEWQGNVKIYGDGVLIYEKKGIASNTKAFPIEVKITGVTDLKIDIYGLGDDFDPIRIMLCNTVLQKQLNK